MGPLCSEEIRTLVRAALAEDVGSGDVTTLSTIPDAARMSAVMVAREPLVAAGLAVGVAVFHELSAGLSIVCLAEDGQAVTAGQGLMKLGGSARAILTAERVALNFVQHLSGIASLTRRFVNAVRGTGARILDTRKTTPGLRRLEKYAVACGGGQNHRLGLFDMVLIKDNHLAALKGARPDPIAAAVKHARARHPELRVEVEADTLEQVDLALAAGADVILLDNMSLEQLGRAVQKAHGRALTEASGGVNLGTVRSIADTGVDFISVGALTHSAPAVDIALDFEAENPEVARA